MKQIGFSRARALWDRVRDSLWFLPGVLTIVGATLALSVTGIERRGFALEGAIGAWVFGGGAEGARGVLTAIASSLITVTGVVFSVTIVALQLASSQYTPRLLRDFTADRGNQLVLGVFIGTFTYTLLVLRTVRSPDEGASFVPGISVTLAIILAILNIGVLIFFIDHSARSIQVSTILSRVTKRTLADIERLFPDGVAEPAAPPSPAKVSGPSWRVDADRSGYLQGVDAQSLFDRGRNGSHVIEMQVEVGSFVLRRETLAIVRGAEPTDETRDAVRSAFVLGGQRTPGQDVEFGLIEISDIAVKALSPGINDPTTALHCIDRIAEVLVFLGQRAQPTPIRSEKGVVHFVALHRSFEDTVTRTLQPIRQFGSEHPLIACGLLRALRQVADMIPLGRRAVIERIALAIAETAQTRIDSAADREMIAELAEPFRTKPRLA